MSDSIHPKKNRLSVTSSSKEGKRKDSGERVETKRSTSLNEPATEFEDQRITIRDKYDVIIRPSSPPFVTVVPKGQPILQASDQRRGLDTSVISSASQKSKQSFESQSFVSARFSFSDGSIDSNVSLRKKSPSTEPIYSNAIRRLAKGGYVETNKDVIERCLELLPLPKSSEPSPQVGALTIKTPIEIEDLLKTMHFVGFNLDSPKLRQVNTTMLNELWDDAKGHEKFNQFIRDLYSAEKPYIHWTDVNGQPRTMPSFPKRVFLRQQKNVDPESSSTSLKRGYFRKKGVGEEGYVRIDAASTLAISCHHARDFDNFARVVAAEPRVVATLLDEKKISAGPIFTDENIWLCIAYSIAPLKARGGRISDDMTQLSRAFENYLSFFNSSNLTGPYAQPLKWIYHGGSKNADALVNSPEDFKNNFNRIWERLCPEENGLRDIIDRPERYDNLDAEITSYFLHIVFSGAILHFNNVAKRQAEYAKAVLGTISLGSSVPLEAMKNATAPVDGGLSGGAASRISDMLLQEGGKKIAKRGVKTDFEEQQRYFKSLHAVIIDNASKGRFVPGQRILTQNQMLALEPSATKGRVEEADKRSGEGDPSSIRDFFVANETGLYEIKSDKEFKEIGDRRRAFGEKFSELMKKVRPHNLAEEI